MRSLFLALLLLASAGPRRAAALPAGATAGTHDQLQEPGADDPSLPAPEKIMQDLDTNHDGRISLAELGARMKLVHDKETTNTQTSADSSAEELKLMLADQDQKDWFANLDKNGDKGLTIEEKLADLAGDLSEHPEATAEEKTEHQKQLAELKRLEIDDFRWSDRDKSGKLSFEEMVMGYMRPRMPEANDHGVHFADTDTNTDHHVSLEEHLHAHAMPLGWDRLALTEEENAAHVAEEDDIQRVQKERFEAADKNHDGKLDAEEHKSMFLLSQEEAGQGVVKALMEIHDKDANGEISLEELKREGDVNGASLGWETHPPHVEL